MKKSLIFALTFILATNMFAELYNIKTPNMSLVIDASKGKKANFVYFGPQLSELEVKSIPNQRGGRMTYTCLNGNDTCRWQQDHGTIH